MSEFLLHFECAHYLAMAHREGPADVHGHGPDPGRRQVRGVPVDRREACARRKGKAAVIQKPCMTEIGLRSLYARSTDGDPSFRNHA